MSAWLDGRCPSNDPAKTVGERLDKILFWIDEELKWVTPANHPGLHAVLLECKVEAERVRDTILNYDPLKANQVFIARGRAGIAFNLPPDDPGAKETEWRGARDTLITIQV